MQKKQHTYTYAGNFTTENGNVLASPELFYTTYGTINADGSNVVWVCHALTADSDVFSWWEGLFGENDLFNPDEYFIVCVNNPGSCYGSVGPLSVNPVTGQKYRHHFPELNVPDVARLLNIVRQHLGITNIKLLIGGSQGGHIAQECILTAGFEVENLVLIATSAKHSPWGIAFNETQRMCIETDSTWKTDADNAGLEGMKTARALALLSYRNYETYGEFQSGENADGVPKTVTYQRYQGDKLARRFNAYSYYILSRLMDSHDVGRNRESVEAALAGIHSATLVIGVSSDILFPPKDQAYLAQYIPQAQFVTIDSIYGHDGFLTESKKLADVIGTFIKNTKKSTTHTNA